MLQRLNRSLTPQCLLTPEMDEKPLQVDNPAVNEKIVAGATIKTKKQGTRRRNNKKTSLLPNITQKQAKEQPNSMQANQMPLCAPHPENAPRARSPPVSILGAVPTMAINFPTPPFTGPFNFPPPPLGTNPFTPFVPPPPFGPSMPMGWQRCRQPPCTQLGPRIPPLPQPRTSSPLPMQRRIMRPPTNQQEEDYLRWMMQLEEGRKACGRPIRGRSNMDNQLNVDTNGYNNQAPQAVPVGLPMQCNTMMIPVGYLPNGCYGPMLQGAFCYPSGMYMRDVVPAPLSEPFLNHPYQETVV